VLSPTVLLVLALAGLVAGFVDAIAGGGGLISVPVLLSAGLPPIGAIASNKLQSSVGTTIAATTYWREGLVKLRPLLPAVVATAAGSLCGAFTLQHIDPSQLEVTIPIALVAVALYMLFAPKLTDADRAARLSFARYVPVMGLIVGFYDGCFGPGTGSFLTLGFIVLFGLGVTRAAAHTKILNLTANVAALVLFALSGRVVWSAGLAMALGQLAGGYLGARTGIRFGARIIRPLVVLVSVVLAIRLLVTGHS
jgi:uncharacterized membrane protein YfcA